MISLRIVLLISITNAKIETTEHLFVAKLVGSDGDYYANTDFFQQANVINNKLLEAESDYDRIDTTKFHRELNRRQCQEFHNSLELAKHMVDDDFLIIREMNGNSLTTYIKNSNIFIPNCEENYKIEIEEQREEIKENTICFKEIPIIWSKEVYKNSRQVTVTGTGFINNNKIITKESKKVNCKEQKDMYIIIEQGRKAIVRKRLEETIIIMVEVNIKENVKVHTYSNIHRLNLQHFTMVNSDIDANSVIKITEIKKRKYVYVETKKEDQGLHIYEKLKSVADWIVEYVLIAIIILLIIICIIVVTTKVIKCCRKMNVKKVNLLEGLLPEEVDEPKRIYRVQKEKVRAPVKKEEDLDSVTKLMLGNFVRNLQK